MRAAFADQSVQTQAAEAQSQADCDAPRQALAATPETLARLTCRPQRITGLLMRLAKTRARYYDPLFERPDLIDDDYYRFRNQPRD